MLAHGDAPDITALDSTLALLDRACQQHDEAKIKTLLAGLVPVVKVAAERLPPQPNARVVTK